MQINNDVSFGAYHSVLKTLWKKGQLPSVRIGFYGDVLTRENISLEHLSQNSHCGRSDLCNLVLASQRKNRQRGSKPLWQVINMDRANEYLDQFKPVHIPGKFDGHDYIRMVTRRLLNMGIDLQKE